MLSLDQVSTCQPLPTEWTTSRIHKQKADFLLGFLISIFWGGRGEREEILFCDTPLMCVLYPPYFFQNTQELIPKVDEAHPCLLPISFFESHKSRGGKVGYCLRRKRGNRSLNIIQLCWAGECWKTGHSICTKSKARGSCQLLEWSPSE